MLLVPLSYLPYFVSNLIWCFLNLWFLYRIWIVLGQYCGSSVENKQLLSWTLAFSLVFSLRFILHNFEMLQITLFILWGALESLALFNTKRPVAGALLLALVINVKLLPLVLVPYLFVLREIKSLCLFDSQFHPFHFAPSNLPWMGFKP